jgi:HSP20 family protein
MNSLRKKGSAADMNRWDPLRDLLSVQERINRLFEDAFGDRASAAALMRAGVWSPAVDIGETEEEFIVMAEVPDVKQSDVGIRVKGTTLIIEGERRPQRTLMEGYHRIERAYGRFQRSFLMPGPVDQDKITATLRDGILKIVLPKKAGANKRRIEITGT